MRRRERTWAGVTAAALLAWAAAALWLVPSLIRTAYAGESLPIFNAILEGRDQHGVDRYLAEWNELVLPATAALIVVLALAFVWLRWPEPRRRILAWLLGGPTPLGGPTLILFGLAAGVLGGLLQAGFLTARQAISNRPAQGYYPELLWMTPAAAAIGYVLIAAALASLARGAGAGMAAARATFVFATLVLYGVAQSEGIPIAGYAKLLLSLGLAAVIARGAAARTALVTKAIRRGAPAAALLLVILVTAGFALLPAARERRALAKLPAAARDAPNVILLILDTVRAANLGLHGYRRPTTPHIEEWAARGVVFDRAVSTTSWTLPSHAAMMTGHYNFMTGSALDRPLDDRHPTLAEILSQRGYATAGFVANLGYTSRMSGLARGFTRYEDWPLSFGLLLHGSWLTRAAGRVLGRLPGYPHAPRKDADYITSELMHWLDRRDDRPFFAFLNYFDAHDPYFAPDAFAERFGPRPPPGVLVDHVRPATTERLQPFINLYDACITYIDDRLGRLFAELKARDLAHNTLVILTSDHGEMFGEHRQIQHGAGLYMPALHVPLAIVYPPRVPAGVRISRPVTLRDLPATILDVIGADAELPGRSLAHLWRADSAASVSTVLAELDAHQWSFRSQPVHRGDMKSLVRGRLHYIRNGDAVEELYDPSVDPREENDLAARPENEGAMKWFRAALDSVLRPGPGEGEFVASGKAGARRP